MNRKKGTHRPIWTRLLALAMVFMLCLSSDTLTTYASTGESADAEVLTTAAVDADASGTETAYDEAGSDTADVSAAADTNAVSASDDAAGSAAEDAAFDEITDENAEGDEDTNENMNTDENYCEAEEGADESAEAEADEDAEAGETEEDVDAVSAADAKPATFVWEDDEKVVTVVLADPDALPEGAEFVVVDLTQEEYDAYKELVIEQQFANDSAYGETKEERTAYAEAVLASMVLYDMHFVCDGEEIEPDANTMAVTIENKTAVEMETEETVTADGYVMVRNDEADVTYTAIHVEENGKKETVVDVTDKIDTDASGAVETVEVTVDSFSTIGYYMLTEYQSVPITNETLINDWGGSYTLYFILNNYNIFTSGDVVAQHTVGAVAVGGTSKFPNGIGSSNYGTHPVPSYFQGGFVSGGFNDYKGWNAMYFTAYDSNVYSYVYQSQDFDVRFNDGGTGTIDSSVTHDNGYFIDFDKAMAAITSEMDSYVSSSSNITVKINNTSATLADDHYTVSSDGKTVTVQSGYSYVFDDLDEIDYINVITGADANDENVNIISKESGTVVLPKVLLNGNNPTGEETDNGCGLVFMLPNATTVDIGTKSNGTFLGHVVAPNAAVESSVGGNTNGSFICASYNVPDMEAHMWHYNGNLIVSDSHGFTALKTLDNAAPTDADDEFSFTLSELNSSGKWGVLQTKKAAYTTGLVTFDSISYSAEGTHWYLIAEETGDTDKYTFDSALYVVKVEVTSSVSGTTTTYDAAATYYEAASGTVASDLIQSSTASGTTTYTVDTSNLYALTLSSADAETSEIFKFENTTKTGSLWITKNVTVNGNSTAGTEADGTYTFYVKDSNSTTVRTVEITITNGQSETVEVSGLPLGTYMVEEDVAKNPAGMTISGNNNVIVTVEENGTAENSTASFTNNKVAVGSLTITKNVTVDGNPTTGTKADGTYTFQIFNSKSELKDTVQITITNGQSNSVTVDNLEKGLYYINEVLSNNPAGMELVGDNSIVVEVTANNTASIPVASFTNNLTQTGSLQITKNVTVNGEPASEYSDPTVADGRYTFYIVDEYGVTKADRTLTIVNGQSVTERVDNLEPGEYTVYEYVTGNPTGMTLVGENGRTVTVYSDNKNNDGVTTIETAEFTNDLEQVGSLMVKKEVKINGEDASGTATPTAMDGTYTFSIRLVETDNGTEIETEVARTTVTILNGTSPAVEVDNLVPGTYRVYELTDLITNGSVLLDPSGKEYVEVTVTADNKVSDTIQTATFTNNLYDAEFTLKAAKRLTGRTLESGQFTFTATEVDASGDDVDNGYSSTVSNRSNGSITFDTITYTGTGTHYYKIAESVPNPKAGYTYDEFYYIVKVEVTDDDQDGKLSVLATEVKKYNANGDVSSTVTYDGTDEIDLAETIAFTNEYKATGTLSLDATKNLTSLEKTLAAEQFTFQVTGGNISDTVNATNAADGTVTFTNVDSYDQDDIGMTFTYEVKEVNTGENGYTYDTTVYTVKVEVVDNGDGTLEANILSIVSSKTGGTVSEMVFDNIYTENDEIVLEATKLLEKGTLKAGQFSFTATEVTDAAGSTEKTTVNSNGDKVNTYKSTAKNDAGGEIIFDEITYDTGDVGDHYYKISEVIPTGDEKLSYIEYDNTYYIITVTVGGEANVKPTAAITGISKVTTDDSGMVTSTSVGTTLDAVEFTNFYTAKGTLNLEATKTLKTGETDLQAEQFTFQVTGGKISGTVEATNAADGTVAFKAVDSYDQTDIGKTYYYTVEEVDSGADGYTYDTTVYTVAVHITDNSDGTLNIAKTYTYSNTANGIDNEPATAISFTNTYETEGEITLKAKKILKDKTWTNQENREFRFEIVEVEEDPDNSGTFVENGGFTGYGDNDANGTITFQTIPYTHSGTYYYKITERNDGKSYYSYDNSYYIVTVNVTDNSEGKLNATVTAVTHYDEDGTLIADNNTNIDLTDAVEFTNYYLASGTLSLEAEKTLDTTETALQAGQFTFKVTGDKISGEITATNSPSGKVRFTDIVTYDQTDIDKTYYYTITEVDEGKPGYTYDNTVYVAKVTVSDEEMGQLSTDVTYYKTNVEKTSYDASDLEDVDTVTFENSYSTSGSITLGATKVLEGRDLEADQFTFNIVEVDADGAAVTDGYSGTAENAADGTISFPEITYKKSGTHYYKITEEDDGKNRYTYDSRVYTVTVEAVDQQDGTIAANVTEISRANGEGSVTSLIWSGDASKVVVFTNTYEELTADFSFIKVSDQDTDQSIAGSEYGLFAEDADGELVQVNNVYSDANGLVYFDELAIDTEYTVKELNPPAGSYVSAYEVVFTYTYDEDTDALTLVILDGGSGTLLTDENGSYVTDENGNLIWLEAQTEVSVLKTDEDGNPLAGAVLQIQDEDGNPVVIGTDENGEDITSWVTTTKAKMITSILATGKTYFLVELEAPDGYEIADPIEFMLETEPVAPGAEKVVELVMVDKKSTTTTTTTTTKKTTKKTTTKTKTGDAAPIIPYVALILAALAVAAGVVIRRRRRAR